MTVIAPGTRVALVGQPFWTSRLAALLNTHASDMVSAHAVCNVGTLRELATTKCVVRVGYRPGAPTWRGRLVDTLWAAMRAVREGLPTAYYWIGTDVLHALSDHRASKHTRWFEAEAATARHWAGAPWLAVELRDVGIPAESVLFPAWLPPGETVSALPDAFRVASYVPDLRPEFYGAAEILGAARRLPQIQFLIVGGSGTWASGIAPPNVRFLGWVDDVTATYLQSTVIVRLVVHDAVGGSVREALALGRHVLYTYDLPHTIRIPHGNGDLLVKALSDLFNQHQRGELPLNRAGMAYARREFDPVHLTRQLAWRISEAALA